MIWTTHTARRYAEESGMEVRAGLVLVLGRTPPDVRRALRSAGYRYYHARVDTSGRYDPASKPRPVWGPCCPVLRPPAPLVPLGQGR